MRIGDEECCSFCVYKLPNNKNARYRKGVFEFCSPRCKSKFLKKDVVAKEKE